MQRRHGPSQSSGAVLPGYGTTNGDQLTEPQGKTEAGATDARHCLTGEHEDAEKMASRACVLLSNVQHSSAHSAT